jgi:hypothetical protein
MREYTLIPSDKLSNRDVVSVSSDPVLTQKINNAQDLYRKKVASLSESFTPEIQLQLLNYFKKHLEGNMKNENPPKIEGDVVEPENSTKTEESDVKLIDQFLSSLPKNVTKLGNTLARYLVSLRSIRINENGFLFKDGSNQNVHLLDIVKTLVTPNYRVSNDVRLFIENINIPDTFKRNRNLKLKKI